MAVTFLSKVAEEYALSWQNLDQSLKEAQEILDAVKVRLTLRRSEDQRRRRELWEIIGEDASETTNKLAALELYEIESREYKPSNKEASDFATARLRVETAIRDIQRDSLRLMSEYEATQKELDRIRREFIDNPRAEPNPIFTRQCKMKSLHKQFLKLERGMEGSE